MKQHMDSIVAALLDAGISLEMAQELFLDAYVSAALRRSKDNVTSAAAALGTHRNTLHNIIHRRPAVRESMKRARHKSVRTQEQLRVAHLIEKGRSKR